MVLNSEKIIAAEEYKRFILEFVDSGKWQQDDEYKKFITYIKDIDKEELKKLVNEELFFEKMIPNVINDSIVANSSSVQEAIESMKNILKKIDDPEGTIFLKNNRNGDIRLYKIREDITNNIIKIDIPPQNNKVATLCYTKFFSEILTLLPQGKAIEFITSLSEYYNYLNISKPQPCYQLDNIYWEHTKSILKLLSLSALDTDRKTKAIMLLDLWSFLKSDVSTVKKAKKLIRDDSLNDAIKLLNKCSLPNIKMDYKKVLILHDMQKWFETKNKFISLIEHSNNYTKKYVDIIIYELKIRGRCGEANSLDQYCKQLEQRVIELIRDDESDKFKELLNTSNLSNKINEKLNSYPLKNIKDVESIKKALTKEKLSDYIINIAVKYIAGSTIPKIYDTNQFSTKINKINSIDKELNLYMKENYLKFHGVCKGQQVFSVLSNEGKKISLNEYVMPIIFKYLPYGAISYNNHKSDSIAVAGENQSEAE